MSGYRRAQRAAAESERKREKTGYGITRAQYSTWRRFGGCVTEVRYGVVQYSAVQCSAAQCTYNSR